MRTFPLIFILSCALQAFHASVLTGLPACAANAETAESLTRPVLVDETQSVLTRAESLGARVWRFPQFDLRQANAAFDTDGRPRWRFEAEHHGHPAYVLEIADRRRDPFTDWSTSARHPLPLLPNRSYVVSVLMRASFPRPAEVNLGLKFVDHGGKQVIWSLNGLANQTEGWQRWEWRLTTDPRTTHGLFSILPWGQNIQPVAKVFGNLFFEHGGRSDFGRGDCVGSRNRGPAGDV
jgi:hypothetical protein